MIFFLDFGSIACYGSISVDNSATMAIVGRFRKHAGARGIKMTRKTIANLVVFLLLTGCGFSTEVPSSKPSGLEQMLVVSSLERATAKLRLDRYRGKRVYVDFFSQVKDDRFIRGYITTMLRKEGAEVVDDAKKADLILKTFATVVGIDTAVRLFGLSEVTTPLVGMTVPEIALYKSINERGYSDLRIFAFDGRTGRFLSEESPRAVGKSNYDQYTLLIVIKFSVTDVTEPIPKTSQKLFSIGSVDQSPEAGRFRDGKSCRSRGRFCVPTAG